MPAIAFGVQVPADKVEAAKKMLDDLVSHQHDHHHARQKSRGYSRIKIFHQKFPTEQFIIYAEAKDLAAAMAPQEGDSGFEAEFNKRFEELVGHHLDSIQSDASELMMDWHEERGGSRSHHS
ncbi:MAG TPA: hypothetical protein VMW62_18635 [Chloroflexota bacterium]|nr:hypothetical protein [Chloroflexota bacterium]